MIEFEGWLGRTRTEWDIIEPARTNALASSLGSGSGTLAVGDPLPLLHHWLYFWDVKPPDELGVDGHPAKGGFLPPVPLPRRMWAGGRLSFHTPVLIGECVSRTSTITTISEKHGRSGTLVFVTVNHELRSERGLLVGEEQDLVYREASDKRAPMHEPAPPPECAWRQECRVDPVLLFRYSALTMNGHRIHYDRVYATEEEFYPALVVQGPLQATMLMKLVTDHVDAPVVDFAFRGQSPAFDGQAMQACASPGEGSAELWMQQGVTKTMTASVRTG